MINITNTKETQDNLEVPVFTTTQETCEVKEFLDLENVHQGLELPKFMEKQDKVKDEKLLKILEKEFRRDFFINTMEWPTVCLERGIGNNGIVSLDA